LVNPTFHYVSIRTQLGRYLLESQSFGVKSLGLFLAFAIRFETAGVTTKLGILALLRGYFKPAAALIASTVVFVPSDGSTKLVFPSLTKYLEERRLYRRDKRDRIVKDRDNLQDAVRCLVNGISTMRTKLVKVVPPWPEDFGRRAWMAY
jgi:hypothetical protein